MKTRSAGNGEGCESLTACAALPKMIDHVCLSLVPMILIRDEAPRASVVCQSFVSTTRVAPCLRYLENGEGEEEREEDKEGRRLSGRMERVERK